MTIAEQLLKIFGGNPHHAIGKLRDKGSGVWYEPVEKPITLDLLDKHLAGSKVVGSYPIMADQTVTWLGWDIDDAENLDRAKDLAKKIIDRVGHLPHAVEFSGGKGYHIYLFLDKPMPAVKAKEFAEAVRKAENLPRSGNPHVECYPKQAQTGSKDGRRSLGNLIKIPLGEHLTTHERSRFVDPANGWEAGPEVSAEEVLDYRVTAKDLETLTEQAIDRVKLLAEGLAVEWDAGKRHDLSLYLAGYLYQLGWSYDKAAELITAICELRSDEDLNNRLQAVRDTYRKATQGSAVAGFLKLSEVLSGQAMSLVSTLAPQVATPAIANRVDKVRWDKGPGWQKERFVAELIWGYLTDREQGGRVLRVAQADKKGQATFWFSATTKLVMPLDSRQFEVFLYQNFHLNIEEQFTRRVVGLLYLKAESQGDVVEVHKTSLWREGVLYLSLGGSEIYVLNGEDKPSIVMNGEQDLFFQTKDTDFPEPDFDNPLDIWEHLIDDLNFSRSELTPIPANCQAEMLKAWMLSMFFRSMLPTRPILTMLGAPGSGKTTAMRRILRLIEGLEQDVLEVVEDKPDSWRVVVENNSFIVLDNLEETSARWLPRALDQIATGSMIQIRQLYTSNRTYTIKADTFVALTAVNMPFSKSTLFERLLVLNMDKLSTFVPSYFFDRNLRNGVGGMWADLITKLNTLVAHLNKVGEPNIAIAVRMSDFAMFCAKIEDSGVVDGPALRQAMSYLGSAQQAALSESEHSAFPLIRDWIERNPEEAAEEHTSASLFSTLSTMAKKQGRSFRWKSSTALAHHLRAMKHVLESELGMEIESQRDVVKGRNKLVYSFPSLAKARLGMVQPGEEQNVAH